jgi:hypothetical protein
MNNPEIYPYIAIAIVLSCFFWFVIKYKDPPEKRKKN